jgi:hypothetical protein
MGDFFQFTRQLTRQEASGRSLGAEAKIRRPKAERSPKPEIRTLHSQNQNETRISRIDTNQKTF